jgi:hypothetical protein
LLLVRGPGELVVGGRVVVVALEVGLLIEVFVLVDRLVELVVTMLGMEGREVELTVSEV